MRNIDRDVDRLDDLLFKIGTSTGGSYAELIDVAADAVGAYRKNAAPQIIRTPAELEALDKSTWLAHRDGSQFSAAVLHQFVLKYGAGRYLPAVVVASGEHVRACREALEGETT